MRPNYTDFAQSAALLPLRMLGLARTVVSQRGRVALMDLALQLAEALPSGLYDSTAIQDYLEAVLGDPDRTNDFRMLDNELYLTATDLDTCERIVLGGEDWDDVPISRAVAASTALPMVYKPVEIKGRQLIDGGIRSTTNVDIAVERGAKFVIVVNPLVPYVNDFQKVIPTMMGSRVRRVADMGFPQIGYQTFKLLAHQRLHEAVSHWQEKYPGVDIILIEPDPERRADVRDEHHELHQARRDRQARLRVGHHEAGQGLRRAARRSAPGTASRSRPRACARSSAASPRSASAPPAGGGSSSRRPGALVRQSDSARARQRGGRWRPRCGPSPARGRRRRAGRRGPRPRSPGAARWPAPAPSCPSADSQTKLAWLGSARTGSSPGASISALALADHRVAPPLDLGAADLQRLLDRRTG